MKKMTKILIAYDGSPFADEALEDLRLAGLGRSVQVKVLTVFDPRVSMRTVAESYADFLAGDHATDPDTNRSRMKEAREISARGADRLRKLFPGWSVSTAVTENFPAEGILKLSESWRPSLIVMGTRGQTMLERILLGSVSSKVLAHAGRTVRIARKRPRLRDGGLPRIVLAMDGSQNSQAVLRNVVKRSWPQGSLFRIVVAADARISRSQDFTPAQRKAVDLARHVAHEALQELQRHGLQARAIVREGDARLVVPKAVRLFRANGLFIGRRGLGAVRRLMLGGISSHLAQHAPCTVEVVSA